MEQQEDITRKEQARLECEQRYERRIKEKQEKEVEDDTLKDLVVKLKSKDSKTPEVTQETTDNPRKAKQEKTKNPCGKKARQEAEMIQDIEEEDEEIEIEETTSK